MSRGHLIKKNGQADILSLPDCMMIETLRRVVSHDQIILDP